MNNTRTVGFDYGLKPRVALVSNASFPGLLHEAFVALAYGRIPHFGGLREVLCLGMCFDNGSIARQCFSIFKGWADESKDGDALTLSFIEFDDRQYGLCIYPDTDRLVRRMVSEMYREEIDPFIISVGHLKLFPRCSEGYLYFRTAAERDPFVLFPQIHDGPLLNFAFIKNEVRFFKEREVPEGSMEGELLGIQRNDLQQRALKHPAKSKSTQAQATARRRRQISRFYPVTLERLSWDTDFETSCRDLESDGYRRWQVEQAACTLLLRLRIPHLFYAQNANEGEDHPQMRILGHLLANPEDATDLPIPVTLLKEQMLREQIEADSAELLAYFSEGNDRPRWGTDLQSELSKYGLLEG